jgi:uncharacterized repeat protein (TIGR01451 family)
VNADYELVLTKTADRSQVRVGETINFTLTVTNNGPAAVTGGVGVGDVLSPCLTTTEQGVTVSRAGALIDVDQVTQDGVTLTVVSVGYVGQAANETVTIKIAATVTCVPPTGQGANAAFVVTQEGSQLDDTTDNEDEVTFAVLGAGAVAPSASATVAPSASATARPTTSATARPTTSATARPTTSATARPTVQPSGTTAPTAKPSTPAGLPDTGAGSTTTLVLVLVAGALLASGVAAQAVLRRRTR